MVALLVVGTFVLLILADALVSRRKRRDAPAARVADAPPGAPGGLFIDVHHAWVALAEDGRVRVGLDELARKLTGPIESVRLPDGGARVVRGETLLWVKSGEVEVPIAAPLTGTVDATQTPDPRAAGTDGAAWFVTLRPERLAFELRGLRVAEDAAAWLRAACARLSESLHGLRAASAGALPDGGAPVDGLLRSLEPQAREKLVREFL